MNCSRALNRIKLNNNSGNITVMVSLMLSAVILFMITVNEGINIYLNKARCNRHLVTASESVMADYNRELWNDFGILALDSGYSTDNVNAVGLKFNEYMLNETPEADRLFTNLYRYTIDEVDIRDRTYLVDDIEYLKNEIRELMKYEVAEDGIDKIIEKTKLHEDEAEVDKAREDVIDSNNRKMNESNGEAKLDVSGDADDPRKEFKKAIKKGMLALVIGENNVSDVDYGMRDLFDDDKVNNKSKFKEYTGLSFKEADELTDMLEVDKDDSFGDDAINLALTTTYIKEHFSHYESGLSGDAICNQEYLICGQQSDVENLKGVVDKILALRFVSNYLYVVKNAEHQTEAKELATALVGATGNIAAVEVVSYLLLAVLAYSQSIVDVRSLLSGKRVPLVHNPTTFKLNMKNMIAALTGADKLSANAVDKGVSYEDYLTFFIVTKTDQDLKYKRMLTLMDALIRKEDDSFDITRMLFSYKVKVKASAVSLFGGSANAAGQVTFNLERIVSY